MRSTASGASIVGALVTTLMAMASACSTRAMTMNSTCDGSASDACEAGTNSAVDAVDVAEASSDDVPTDDGSRVDAPVPVDVVEACVPSCGARTCGDNGCGGTCGSCSAGSVCGASGSCEPDPSTRWIVEAVDAMVLERNAGGSTWDPFGGAPDPFVCITIGSDRQCSDPVTDSLSPVWNFRHPTSATTGALQAGVRFEVRDSDSTSGDDVIGDVMAMAPDNAFVDPVWTVTVGRSTVRVRLTVAP